MTSILDHYSPMFIFLQEHWLPQYESNSILDQSMPEYSFLTTADDMFIPPEDRLLIPGPVWHGTAIGWHKSFDRFISKLPIVSERFCGVYFEEKIFQIEILSYSIYFPTSGQDDHFLEVLDLLDDDISRRKNSNTLLILGTDTNCSDKSTIRRQNAMQKFMDKFSLQSLVSPMNATFHHNNGTSSSQIDNILYHIPNNVKAFMNMKKHLCNRVESSNISAHDVIVGEIDIEIVTSSHDDRKPLIYSQFDPQKPKWDLENLEKYQKDSYEAVKVAFDTFKSSDETSLLAEAVSQCLVQCANDNFQSSRRTNYSQRNKFPKEMIEAHAKHKVATKNWRDAGCPRDINDQANIAMKKSRKNLQQIT